MKNNLTTKLSRAPFRGIMSEIAVEEKVTRQNIWKAINIHQNPRIIQKALDKIKERKKTLKGYRDALSAE